MSERGEAGTKMDDVLFNILRDLSYDNGMEFCTDSTGYICIRQMHFNDEGIRELRYSPDPCEFKKPETAIASLMAVNRAKLALWGEMVKQLTTVLACLETMGDCYGNMEGMRSVLSKARALDGGKA